MGQDSGNSLLYRIVEVILDEQDTIEKDINHTKSECKKISLYFVSDTEFILSACFHLDSLPACYFYYDITAQGRFKNITNDDFSSMVNEKHISEMVEMEWSKDAELEKKQEDLYNNIAKFGPSYNGNKTLKSVSLSEIEDNNTEMEQRVSDNSGMNVGAVVILELAAVVIVFLIMKWVLGKCFK